jgi:hypothetical protein
MVMRIAKVFLISSAAVCCGFTWGFFAHRQINRLAVFTLPPEMIGFYKKNISFLTDASCDPDRRRYAVADEGPRHFIDLDRFGNRQIPQAWSDAVTIFGEDTLFARGIVPWHIYRMQGRLRDAFFIGDPKQILRISAELGHYVADAHVPLHTSSNYDGQQTGQTGLHAFWESRLPELFFDEYDFFVGKARYVDDVKDAIWRAVFEAHRAVDSVISFEAELGRKDGSRKYGFETRGKRTVKLESEAYAKAYHQMLRGMVERQMQSSVKMIGDLWYTAWMDAGQPDLRQLLEYAPSEEEINHRRMELHQWNETRYAGRVHEN